MKNKFLLTALNAKYIHSNPALFSLRAYAVKMRPEYEQNIEIAEYTINHREEDILAGIYKAAPNVVAFSCYIWNWNMIRDLIPEVHKLMPEVPIWLGGPEVSYEAEQIFSQFPYLAGVMIGEGEQTFLELMEYYVERRGTLEQIPGLCLATGFTAVRPLTDMTSIPFLYEDLSQFTNRIIYYESSRGCPFRCSYCLSSIDKQVRFRNLDVVKKELQFFLDQKVAQVKFVDRTFNCKHEHAYAIWQYIHEHDNGVTNFHFEIAADIMNEDEIALLHQMRPGLVQLEIGVQSTNEQCLQEIDRGMSIRHLREVVRRIQEGNNIHIHLDLIAGLPYENYDSFVNSFNEVYAMGPEQLQLGFLKVLKGSKMHDKAVEYGLAYLGRPPYEVLYTNWLSYEEILDLKRVEEMVEQYYNSNQYTHTLPVLAQVFESPFALFHALADYYTQMGYDIASPARSYRYQVLFDFACVHDPAQEQLYRELLLFDLYLRENLKSRPAFATDQSAYYGEIVDFYREEEANRVYLPNYSEYNAKQMSKMTHIEVFTCPPRRILFDYQVRNPLNHEARYIVLPDRTREDPNT